MTTDEKYMHRCLQLARCGQYGAPPNPMVGAVIVSADGRIIGEGFHRKCGEAHAEVNAFRSVRSEDQPLIPESTIYVSLEPCAHFGKTPPCADLIVRQHPRRCVVGTIDPFAQVQGKGIERIKAAGIEVTVGVLQDECRWLNRRFFTFHQQQRPYVTLKWAQTQDGVIGLSGSQRLLISNRATQTICHRMRSLSQAILVGRGTWQADQPQLNLRLWPGNPPQRIVLSKTLAAETTGTDSETAGSAAKTKGIVLENEALPFEKRRASFSAAAEDSGLPSDVIIASDPESLLRELHRQGTQTLLVEGGRATLQSFIDLGLWDEAHVEIGPDPAPALADGESAVMAPRLHHATLRETQDVEGHTLQLFVRQQ